MRQLIKASMLAVAVAVLAAPAATLGAQELGALDPEASELRTLRPAVGAHFGYASIENAANALEVGLFADVGSFRWPWLRTVAGLDYLSSSSQRPNADGTFRDLALGLDLRIKPVRVRTVTPYVGAGVALHFLGTTATDPNVKDIYDGMVVGVQGAVGALVDLRPDRAWGASAELRSVAAQNIGRTSLRLGVFRRF